MDEPDVNEGFPAQFFPNREANDKKAAKTISLGIEGILPTEQGFELAVEMVGIFEDCLNLTMAKNYDYGNAWAKQGWRGNLSRIMSKTDRLRNMLWTTWPRQSTAEAVEDTAKDLVNLAIMFYINRIRGNEWGNG